MLDSTLDEVERQRVELESQVTKLRQALRHWQTWELEYEGLKEEILLQPKQCSTYDLLKAAQDFKADLVDDEEIKSLLGQNLGTPRTQAQVADLLSRRIDYVSRNAQTLRKQLTEAERQRNALLLTENPSQPEDTVLPLTEITEELDEDGNVISSSTNQPAGNAPQLIDVLQKAGVQEVLESDGLIKTISDKSTLQSGPKSDVTKSGKAVPAAPAEMPSPGPKTINGLQEEVASTKSQHRPLSRVAVSEKEFHAEIPEDESEDDATLRREMIDYQSGLDEVGAIVAELELEEGSRDGSELDALDDEEMSFDETDSDDSEDELGRSKKSPLTDKYRQQMVALGEKLQNMGPNPDLPEEVRRQLQLLAPASQIQQSSQECKSQPGPNVGHPKATSALAPAEGRKATKAKKSVAFAAEVEIATSLNGENGKSVRAGLASPQGPSNKVSRFKKNRVAAEASLKSDSRSEETEIQGSTSTAIGTKPLADSVVERPSAVRPQAPSFDDIDERLHQQEIATEYHKMRNRMMNSQGGFVEEREEVILPSENGKRVSRFKAARLR